MKKLLFACAMLFIATFAFADPLTINVSQTPRGLIWPSDGSPCARNLFCRPLTSATLQIFDSNNQLIGTVNSTGADSQLVVLDIGQSATVNLGGFTFTGAALTALPLEYNFFAGFALGNSVNGLQMSSLLTLVNGTLSVSTFIPSGVSSIITFTNGERFQFAGAQSSQGSVTVGITRLGPAAEVPEPMTLILLGSGLAGLAAVKRRRRL